MIDRYWRISSFFQTARFDPGILEILGTIGVILLLVWSLFWKGRALWSAARLGHRKWFVALLVVNTFGILDILYLFVFSKKEQKPSNE